MSAIAEELQMPVGRMIDEGWTGQAKNLCCVVAPRPSSTLPASVLRTTSLLICALLIGFFTVYLLGQHRNQPLTGILSADITTIRVPAASRLTSVQIKAGEEVFSGQPLLTLEKLEHLAFIETQERLVRDLERELKRVEAQAAIELEWRTRELDRELSNVRQRVAVRELDGTTASRVQTANRCVRQMVCRSAAFLPASLRSQSLHRAHERAGSCSSVEPVASRQRVPEPAGTFRMFRSLCVRLSCHAVPSCRIPQRFPRLIQICRRCVQNSRDWNPSAPRCPPRSMKRLERQPFKAHYTEAARQLESMKSVSREVNVMSPVYGTVGQVRYREGDDMQAGEMMLRILHTDRRYVTAYLPTRRVHEMRPGQEVELRFPGNEEFTGQVVDIPMVADLTGQSGETLAAVRIEQVGRLWPNVPVGSQIDVISSR